MPVVTNFPTTNTTSGVFTQWVNPNNAHADDATDATVANAVSNQGGNLWGTFGFDEVIPVGATITAVKVIVEVGVTGAASAITFRTRARVSGANQATHTFESVGPVTYPTVYTVDLTADRGWVFADLLDGVLQVAIEYLGDGAVSTGAQLDFVKAEVTFTSGSTVTTYYFDASDDAPSDPGVVWTNDANAFNGNTADEASTSTNGSVSSNFLHGGGTNAAALRTDRITGVRVRGHAVSPFTPQMAVYSDGLAELLVTNVNGGGGGAWGAYTDVSAPSGGWTWAKIAALEIKFYKPGGTTVAVTRAEVQVTAALPFYETGLL